MSIRQYNTIQYNTIQAGSCPLSLVEKWLGIEAESPTLQTLNTKRKKNKPRIRCES